jgi:quercetin dioxygenase-like cupin family protein
MQITRIYTGDDGESHFETIEIAQSESRYGTLSQLYEAQGVMFRTTPVGGELDFHNAPQRQFVVTLSGTVEIEIGDGSKIQLHGGDILLADDVTGRGHITRDLEGPRHSLFIPLPEDFDVDTLRG